MISVARASALIEAQIRDLGTEHVLLSQAAGRILRQRITAERDQPPFDRVMMDGIAFASGHERREFRIAGTAFAGDPQMTLEHPDECVEVMTGTALPRGCDTIVPVEQISVKDGRAQLSESCAYQQGQFIHRRASIIRPAPSFWSPALSSADRKSPSLRPPACPMSPWAERRVPQLFRRAMNWSPGASQLRVTRFACPMVRQLLRHFDCTESVLLNFI